MSWLSTKIADQCVIVLKYDFCLATTPLTKKRSPRAVFSAKLSRPHPPDTVITSNLPD